MEYMYEKRYKDIGYMSLIFNIISFLVWFIVIYFIMVKDLVPVLMLLTGGLLLYICSFSLIGDRNNMNIDED